MKRTSLRIVSLLGLVAGLSACCCNDVAVSEYAIVPSVVTPCCSRVMVRPVVVRPIAVQAVACCGVGSPVTVVNTVTDVSGVILDD